MLHRSLTFMSHIVIALAITYVDACFVPCLSHFIPSSPSIDLLFTTLFLFFLNDPAPTEISPFPLPDALPIPPRPRSPPSRAARRRERARPRELAVLHARGPAHDRVRARLGRARGRPARRRLHLFPRHVADRKSTRLNSSHSQISYAVFCLKKK